MLGYLLLCMACSETEKQDVDLDGDGILAQDDCDDSDPNVGLGTEFFVDGDGDGYGSIVQTQVACTLPQGFAENQDDCDDGNDAIHPDADEICDVFDNDCDGEVNNGAIDTLVFYQDADGDGYGDESSSMESCEEQDGYVDEGGDCNDEDEEVHPDADEICDEIDNDCDGEIDINAVDAVEFYVDGDGDGYGDATLSELHCALPEGFSENNTDCNDADITTYPSAPEICDGLDNDCDESIPQDEMDGDGDGYISCIFDATIWQGSTDIVGGEDCDDSTDLVNPGADELCSTTSDDDCDGVVNEDDAVDTETWYADSDSDTYGDPNNTQQSCSQPTGYVQDMLDCDDSNASINPQALDIAANGIDEDCSGADAQGIDADGDGFLDTEECNDGDVNINPNASEVCDGVDNNCDGQIDEGVTTTFYVDGDGDGFGSTPVEECSISAGLAAVDGDCDDTDAQTGPNMAQQEVDQSLCYTDADGDGWGDSSPNSGVDAGTDCDDSSAALNHNDGDTDGVSTCDGDCNDSDASINPNASEVCDSIDNNCDQQVDEGVQNTYYSDSDGDGFGDPNTTQDACSILFGYVTDNTDCDDGDASINPNASEVCDGADNDCNTSIPSEELDDDGDGYVECSYSSSTWNGSTSVIGGGDCDDTDAFTYVGAASLDSTSQCMTDGDGDGYGDEQPVSGVIAGTDCDDGDSGVNTGATEVYGDQVDNNCDGDFTDWSEVESIFSSNGCLGCHGSSGGLTITYSNIVSVTDGGTGLAYIEPNSPTDSYLWHKINGTQASVGGGGSKMGNISASDLSYIESWIDEGAPISYANNIESVLSSCTGCHGGSGGFTLSYSNFSNTSSGGIPYVTAGNPAQSYLWKKLEGSAPGGNMASYGGLDQAQLDLIEAWIEAGALP